MPRKTDKPDNVDQAALQQAAGAASPILAVIGKRAFEAEVLESDLPVVVDFWAVFCAPCASMGSMLAALAPLYEGKLKLVKVDLGEGANVPLAREYDITGIPALLPFVHGSPDVDRALIGACRRAALVKWLDELAAG